METIKEDKSTGTTVPSQPLLPQFEMSPPDGIGSLKDLFDGQGSVTLSRVADDEMSGITETMTMTVKSTSLGTVKSYQNRSFRDPSKRLKGKFRAFQITGFPDEQQPGYLTPEVYNWHRDSIDNWGAQWETCPDTGTLHFHIFVKFAHQRSYQAIVDTVEEVLGKHPNVKPVKGSSATDGAKQFYNSFDYCTKLSKRIEGTDAVTFGKPLVKPVPRGAKKSNHKFSQKQIDSNELVLRLYQEKTWSQMVCEHTLLLQNNRGARAYYDALHDQLVEAVPDRILEEVVIYWGAAGTGKSTLAKAPDDVKTRESIETPKEFKKRVWVQGTDMGTFWGDKAGEKLTGAHEVILIDEMGPGHALTLNRFKELCNLGHYGTQVNIKNGNARMNPKKWVFTSNKDPRTWFKKDFTEAGAGQANWNAFKRRVCTNVLDEHGRQVVDDNGEAKVKWNVFEFPLYKPDGTPNAPTNHEDMYYHEDHLEKDYPFQAEPGFFAPRR